MLFGGAVIERYIFRPFNPSVVLNGPTFEEYSISASPNRLEQPVRGIDVMAPTVAMNFLLLLTTTTF